MANQACQYVTLHEFKQKLFSPDPVQLVDVREIDEYRAGHVEGSVLIPLDTLAHRTHELNQNTETVLICRSGNRASQACDVLMERGFRNVRVLSGGLAAWA